MRCGRLGAMKLSFGMVLEECLETDVCIVVAVHVDRLLIAGPLQLGHEQRMLLHCI